MCDRCMVPTTAFRKTGAVWVCPKCQTIFKLVKWHGPGGKFRVWQEVK